MDFSVRNKLRAKIWLLLILIVSFGLVQSQWIDEDDRRSEIDMRSNYMSSGRKNSGRLVFVDKKSGTEIVLIPGLLDETLLTKGSFQFGASRVNFDKLKVSGNIYVNRVNGKVLRDSYEMRSRVKHQGQSDRRI